MTAEGSAAGRRARSDREAALEAEVARLRAALARAGPAEEVLRESEARLRATFEQAAVGIAHVGLDGRWLRVNGRVCAITGYARDELMLKTFQEVTHPADLDDDLALYHRMLAGEIATYTLEKRYIRKDGSSVWINLTVSLVRDGSGAPRHFIAVVEDIEARKVAEAANAHLAAVVASASDAIASFAPEDGRVLTWNSAAERLFGYGAAEMVGRSTARLRPPELAGDEHADLFARAMAGESVAAHETVRVARAGERVPVAVTTTRVAAPDGRVIGVAVVFQDLRPRVRAEAARAENEARLRDLLATLDLGTFMARDLDGTIRFWSEGCARLYGWTAAEAVGRVSHDLLRTVHPVPLAEVEAALERDGEWTGELRHRARDGREVVVAARKVLRRGAGGRPATVLESLADVTAQRRTEARLRESEARLRGLQAELLHVSRLSAAGEMAAALAHELNQPLTAVASAAAAACRLLRAAFPGGPGEAAPAMALEAMDRAAAQALRAGQIVRRMRGFFAEGEAEMAPAELRRLVEEAGMLALADARERGVRVEFRLGPELPPVLVDRVQIQQVLVNLMRNATEAMRGEDAALPAPRRELVVAAAPAGPEAVEVAVSDTGPGLAPEVAGRLFEAFVSTKPAGMGMGLPICRTIVEAHGGRLWAEPNPEGGAVFRFTLMASPIKARGAGAAESAGERQG